MAENRNTALKVGAVGLLALLLFSSKSSGSTQVITKHGAINNPGNIRTEAKIYPGEITSPNPDFKSFASLAYGYAAMIIKLHSYFAEGYDTLLAIINHWAPASDGNDPAAYIQFITDNLGTPIDPINTFPIDDDGEVQAVISLMSDVEQGNNFGGSSLAWSAAGEAFNYA